MPSGNSSLTSQPRQVTFQPSCKEDDSYGDTQMENMDQNHSDANHSPNMNRSQIEQFLKSNPEFLTSFVVNNVSEDRVRCWQERISLDVAIGERTTFMGAPRRGSVGAGPIINPKHSPILVSASANTNSVKKTRPGSLEHVSSTQTGAGSNARSSRKSSTGSNSAANNATTESKPSSGSSTPARKISAQEFKELELPVINDSGSFITDDQVDCTNEELYKISRQQQSSNWKAIDHELLLAELVKDIANELDNRLLCHKILQNLCRLINADRALLYLVEGDKKSDSSYLVNAVAGVTKNSETVASTQHSATPAVSTPGTGADTPSETGPATGNWSHQMRIPLGVGILGTVAKTGETINISNASEDNRFVPGVDGAFTPTGYKITSILCVPILNVHHEVIGVAQTINKGGESNPQAFDQRDIRASRTYLAFCGICLMNARLYNRSRLESKRSKVLLEMARCVFEEQSTVEVLVKRIMKELLNFLCCERCSVAVVLSKSTSNCTTATNATDQNLSVNANSASLLDACKTFHMAFSDLDEFGEIMSDSQSNDNPAPSSEKQQKTVTSFPLYTKILEKCLEQSSADSMVNLNKTSQDPVIGPYLSSIEPNFCPESILCSSIKNSAGEIIGCVQLVNKRDIGFTKADEHFVEAFVIFCGLGISNTRTYEESVELSNKQKVAMEMLSYYTSASDTEIRSVLSHAHCSTPNPSLSSPATNINSDPPELMFHYSVPDTTYESNVINGDRAQSLSLFDCSSIRQFEEARAHAPTELEKSEDKSKKAEQRKISAPPHAAPYKRGQAMMTPQIYSFKLDELKLTEQDTLSLSLAMFRELDIIRVLRTDEKTLVKWLVTTKKNYRQVTYHNWRHAFSVCQLMFTILTTGNLSRHFSPLQKAAFLLATLSHDLDHRGTNNSFQKLTESPLAQLYSTSTLERHHFDRFKAILKEGQSNILSNLNPSELDIVISSVEHFIISTDLAVYFQIRGKFFQVVQDNTFDISNSTHHNLLCSMLMTASDLGAITRPWHVEHQIASMIAEEFFEQGDLEREMYNKDPTPMFDRTKQSEIPKLQLSFIDVICGPVYEHLARLYPSLSPLQEGLNENKRQWSELAAQEEEAAKAAAAENIEASNSST